MKAITVQEPWATVSVRVVRDIVCPACGGDRMVAEGWTNNPMLRPCQTCHGSGTATERVSCAGCRYRAERRCTLLVGIWSGDSIGVDHDFACALWEPREDGDELAG